MAYVQSSSAKSQPIFPTIQDVPQSLPFEVDMGVSFVISKENEWSVCVITILIEIHTFSFKKCCWKYHPETISHSVYWRMDWSTQWLQSSSLPILPPSLPYQPHHHQFVGRSHKKLQSAPELGSRRLEVFWLGFFSYMWFEINDDVKYLYHHFGQNITNNIHGYKFGLECRKFKFLILAFQLYG